MKVVALDMDETLGAFASFARYVAELAPYAVNSTLFGHLLDQNPCYLRPGILEILRFLSANRRIGRCRVVLYTNNPNTLWVKLVKQYLENKLGEPLFDQVIDGLDKRRTGGKCVADLLACARLPKNTPVFFVDDQRHPGMVAATVEYFQIRPYAEPWMDDSQTGRVLLQRLVAFLQCPPVAGNSAGRPKPSCAASTAPEKKAGRTRPFGTLR
jgi:hypothetical protein